MKFTILVLVTFFLTLSLGNQAIPIRVQECVTGDAISKATITVGESTIEYNDGASFTPMNGYTKYTFITEAPNYLNSSQTVSVKKKTTLITLCVNYKAIQFIVVSCATGQNVNGASIQVTSTFYESYKFSFTYNSTAAIGTTWTPVGYQGTYTFEVSAPGFNKVTTSQTVSATTVSIKVCVSEVKPGFCGDGVCSGPETAYPTSINRCFDCGRLRGVVSLAVGQKTLLENITVSVWSDPVNPALYLRNGSQVPPPSFTTLTDSSGFFSIDTLSFDAPASNLASGQLKRRFYFSLTGQYKELTGDVEVVTQLLPLWWNYELTNTQWSGFGSLTDVNNSPTLYLYMTPPFTTNEALIRVILSWGTQISDPTTSISDLDLVVAGPVDTSSTNRDGNGGIINFRNNKDSSNLWKLPYAQLVSDSTYGYGPEVIDIYPQHGQVSLGFSSTYSVGASANAYEIWVDRPNSRANQDNAFSFLYDTNAFIVIYQNDGTTGGNKQVLFDDITGVPYAFGFQNNDQWNKIPSTATLWHIIDFSQSTGAIVFQGFPGENTTSDTSIQPGAKYGFTGSYFENTKSLPCGHVTSRGANPAYCPAILKYIQDY